MNTKSETQQAALYRCTDKASGEVFYTCKSDTTDEWYQVRYNARTLSWSCTCPATKPCKHERAVQEILKIRRARVAEAMGSDTVAVVAELQAKEDKRAPIQSPSTVATNMVLEAKRRQQAPLQRSGFSMSR